MFFLPAILFTFFLGQADSPAIFDVRLGERISADQLARRVQECDVVFFGEEYDQPAGHQLQLALLERLHRQQVDVVLSLEMFERDVQGALDDYLRGRIEEDEFRRHAREWSNYEKDYRPLVEFARKHKIDVIAANVPRSLARAVSEGKQPGPGDESFLPRETTAPRDAYWERFVQVMQEHNGAGSRESMRRYYRAQCLKDDAMAESIADYLASHRHRQPLILHLCGHFHSDFGHGTAGRFLSRRPLARIAVISMEVTQSPAAVQLEGMDRRCHFLVALPKNETREESQETPAAAR